MRSVSILVGVLTVAMLGGIGSVLLAEGRPWIGAVLIGFGVLRLVVLIRQIIRRLTPDPDEEEEEAYTPPDVE